MLCLPDPDLMYKAVLEHAQRQGTERHAFLGDFVGYGADPAWVVEMAREKVTVWGGSVH